MENSVNERIRKVVEIMFSGNDSAFAEKIGSKQSTIASVFMRNSDIKTSLAAKIANAIPELSLTWLITGEGDMLKDSNSKTIKNEVLLLPLEAQAGCLRDLSNSVSLHNCEKIISPIGGVDYAITVSGDSMTPEYPSGSTVLIKKINEKAFIDWGRAYVLDTCNGVVVKKIMPGDQAGCVKCISVNTEYPSFDVSFDDIYGMYRVLMCMSLK